jgi:hypothetical protein
VNSDIPAVNAASLDPATAPVVWLLELSAEQSKQKIPPIKTNILICTPESRSGLLNCTSRPILCDIFCVANVLAKIGPLANAGPAGHKEKPDADEST